MKSILPQNPIFVVGSPRSGTTLLQSLLATQPGIYSFPETHYFSVIEKIAFPETVKGPINQTQIEIAIDMIAEKLELQFSDEERHALEKSAQEGLLTSKMLFESIVIHLLTKQHNTLESPTSFIWVEKTPTHCNFINRIFDFYPAARVLHIVRHPVPAIYSRKEKFPFNKETPFEELARGWGRMQDNVRRHQQEKPQSIFSIRYEDLAENVEKNMEKIGAFLRIRLNLDQLREFHSQTTAFSLKSEPWKQTSRLPEIVNTNGRYKKIASEQVVTRIESIVSNQMEALGYSTFLNNHD